MLPYFLIAPNVTPLRRCLRKKNVKTATGNKKIKVPAAMVVQSIMPEPNWEGMKGGAVCALRLVIINARAYSFQAMMNEKTDVAAIPVADCGRTIFQNVSKRVYPSTSAASSYSIGISSMNPFISQTQKDKLIAV